MNTEYAMINEFLAELYRQTEGDIEKQVSMHDIGAVLGLEKAEAGSLAEELIMDEQVELKTLAGGVGITAKGLETLQDLGIVQDQSVIKSRLSGQPVLDNDDQAIVREIVDAIKKSISQADATYNALEELVIDIKTIEVQMLSPRPKADIVRSVLRSIKGCLGSVQQHGLTAKIEGVLE